MKMKSLTWMKNETMTKLNSDVKANLDRYRSGDFSDMIDTGWSQKSILNYDSDALAFLYGDSKNELEDSLALYITLRALSPHLATRMNVWVPLIHTELLEYARRRWFKLNGSDEELAASIITHVFKGGIGGYRDDNAAGRLWWTGYIGERIAGRSEQAEIKKILIPFMRTTDTRSNVIERSSIFSEVEFARCISEYLADGKLQDSNLQNVFRRFVININLRSNGRHFGDMNKTEVFSFLDDCR